MKHLHDIASCFRTQHAITIFDNSDHHTLPKTTKSSTPSYLHQEAIQNGATAELFDKFVDRKERLAESEDTIAVHPDRSRIDALRLRSQTSHCESKVPQVDIMEKAMAFLNTKEEPKWYCRL